jgi:hypothetical protein
MQEARDDEYTETMKKVRNILSDNVVTLRKVSIILILFVILYFVYAFYPY